ncbi:hypothetical protein GOODEAATRI_026432, partial [Goodea atripinnis]
VFLIVAPLSVLYNWKDELDTWGYFQCVVVHGLRKEEELARIKNGRIEIALTTYETLRLCLDQFNKIDWSAVVVDEAHKIKNPNSQITQVMKELRCKVVYCSLTDLQQTVYQAGLYFTYLAILRKVANHAALLQSTPGTSKKQVFQKFPDFVQRCKNEAFEALSDPMYSFAEASEVLSAKERQSTYLFSVNQDILESYCMAEGLDFSRLDGTTKSRERVQIVKDFNSSSHVNLCLVSTMLVGKLYN